MIPIALQNSLPRTVFWIAVLLVAVLLGACGNRIDPTSDPRTFNGRWQGHALDPLSGGVVISDPSGQHLAIVKYKSRIRLSDKILIRIDPASGDELSRIDLSAPLSELEGSWHSRLRLKPDGGIVILGLNQVYFFNASGVEQNPWNFQAGYISHDGSRVMVRQNDQYSIWDTSTRTQVSSFTLPDEFYTDGPKVLDSSRTLISPNLELFGVARLISGSPHRHVEIELWNHQARKVSTIILSQDLFTTTPIFLPNTLYLSADNSRLMVPHTDGSALFFRLGDGKLMGKFNRPHFYTLVGFAPDGQSAIFLQQEGDDPLHTLHFWSEQAGFFAQQSIQDVWFAGGNATMMGNSAVIASSSGLFARLEPQKVLWKKGPNPLPLSLNLKATYVNKDMYTFSGTAVLASKTYQISGQGRQFNFEFVSAQGQPMNLWVEGTLNEGQQPAFSLEGSYNFFTPSYTGRLTSTGPELVFRLKR